MLSLIQSTAVALCLTTALSLPTNEIRGNKGHFSINQVAGETIFKNGPAQMVKVLKKFNKTVPQHVSNAAANRAAQKVSTSSKTSGVTGSDANNPAAYDREYICPVTVGGTSVNLDFDTGSSDLWVYSNLMPRYQLQGHHYYSVKPAKQLRGSYWNIGYADGSGAYGLVYMDTVTVGGVTATSQAVEAAYRVSSQLLADGNSDGILGLAFSSINTVRPKSQTTFFDTVKSTLAAPVFAATLKKGAPGSYDFGYINPAKYTGALTYTNVDSSRGFWQAAATAYTINATTTTAAITGIFDTGTSLILVDPTIVAAYYAAVPGAQSLSYGYVFPCTATLPSFSITINGVQQTVPGSYMNYAPDSGANCYGGIQSNSGIGLSIFGDVFLKSKYVVFDASVPRIGFAQQA